MTNALATFSKKIDSQLVEPLKNVTIGRKLVPVTAPQGFGISSVDWVKITVLSVVMSHMDLPTGMRT